MKNSIVVINISAKKLYFFPGPFWSKCCPNPCHFSNLALKLCMTLYAAPYQMSSHQMEARKLGILVWETFISIDCLWGFCGFFSAQTFPPSVNTQDPVHFFPFTPLVDCYSPLIHFGSCQKWIKSAARRQPVGYSELRKKLQGWNV